MPTQPSDPVSVVQAAYDRLNEGDLDGYMEFLSDDAVLASPGFRSADSQTIRTHLEINTVQPHLRTEISNISSDGNFVNFTYDEFEAENHLAGPFDDGLTVVVNGKIIFDGTQGYLIIECNQDPSQAFCPEN